MGTVQKQAYGLHDLLGSFGQRISLDWNPVVNLTADVSTFLQLPEHITSGFGIVNNGNQYRTVTVPDGEFWICSHMGYWINTLAGDQSTNVFPLVVPGNGAGQYAIGEMSPNLITATHFQQANAGAGGAGVVLDKLVLTGGDSIGIQVAKSTFGASGNFTINVGVNAQRLHI